MDLSLDIGGFFQNSPMYNMANWIPIKVLGQGSYGVVFLAKQIIGPLYYFAIKVSPLQRHSSLLWEEQILKHFTECPEIVQCFGSEITVERDSPCKAFYNLKLEYAAGGTLDDMIKRQNKLHEHEVKDYLKMILRGLSCIHREGFVHVDLKPDNILVFPQSDGTMKLKISDFGLSERYEKRDDEEGVVCGPPTLRGTPKYMSPESTVLTEVNSALDIWSLGCILVKMVSGKFVWDDCKNHQQLITRLLDEMETPTIPKELSKQGKDFIGKCFERDYKQRWTADMLLQHPYLNQEKEDMKKGDEIPELTKAIYLSHQLCKSETQSSNNGISKILV